MISNTVVTNTLVGVIGRNGFIKLHEANNDTTIKLKFWDIEEDFPPYIVLSDVQGEGNTEFHPN